MRYTDIDVPHIKKTYNIPFNNNRIYIFQINGSLP